MKIGALEAVRVGLGGGVVRRGSLGGWQVE